MVMSPSRVNIPWTLCVVTCCLSLMACSSTSPPVADTVDGAVQPIAPDVPPPAALLALTPTEFNNTIRDLLGFPMNAQDWPDAPPIAAQLLPVQGVKEGVFGLSLVDLPPWPWAFPEELIGRTWGDAPTPFIMPIRSVGLPEG